MAPDAEICLSFLFYISVLKLNTWLEVPLRKKCLQTICLKCLQTKGFKVTISSVWFWALAVPGGVDSLRSLNNKVSFDAPLVFGFSFSKAMYKFSEISITDGSFFHSLLIRTDSEYLLLYLLKRHSFHQFFFFLLFSSKHRVLACYLL